MGKVSIILAVYNGEKYLKQQLESIISQNYNEFELIIVNDASTDNSLDVIDKFNDERIVVINNSTNIGCGKSFEKGILNASGEFIALCDQDDIWERNKLSVLVNEIGEHILIYSDCKIIDGKDKVLKESYKFDNPLIGYDSSKENIWEVSLFNSFVLGCSILFKKSLVKNIIPFSDLSWNHDKWIVFSACNMGRIKYVDKALFYYRIHDNNLSYRKIEKTKIKKIKDALFNHNRPMSFKKTTILQAKDNLKINELLSDIERGKFYYFMKYHNYFNLRKKGYQRFKDNFRWLLNIKFDY